MGKFLYALWLICPTIGKLLILHNMNLSIDVKFGACQFWRVCIICCGVQAMFNHKFFIPDHSLHQSKVFLIYNGIEPLSLQQE